MHELSISRSLLDTVLAHADGQRVKTISVSIGALRQVGPDSLSFCFEIVARDTPCEGARLHLRSVSARLRCDCGHEWELAEPSFRCPRCGGGEVAVRSGEELLVDSIELEEVTCTGPR